MQSTRLIVLRRFLLMCAFTIAPIASWANDIAQFRVARGSVYLERGGQRLPARVGTHLQATDTVVTGADGSAGIAFVDNSLLLRIQLDYARRRFRILSPQGNTVGGVWENSQAVSRCNESEDPFFDTRGARNRVPRSLQRLSPKGPHAPALRCADRVTCTGGLRHTEPGLGCAVAG